MGFALSAERIRCFIAVDIDDMVVLDRIIGAQAAIAEAGADLKLVEPENIHVTVRFLGEIPGAMVDKVREEMDRLRFAPFTVEFKGLGAFPNLRRVNVVWVGMARGEAELRGIFNQLELGLRRIGLPPDNRGFSPHLTIARVRSGRNMDNLLKVLVKMRGAEFGKFSAEALKLKRSVLTPTGPVYSTIHEAKASQS